jgi:hypothetical protein
MANRYRRPLIDSLRHDNPFVRVQSK